jgi:hypothetical protein
MEEILNLLKIYEKEKNEEGSSFELEIQIFSDGSGSVSNRFFYYFKFNNIEELKTNLKNFYVDKEDTFLD